MMKQNPALPEAMASLYPPLCGVPAIETGLTLHFFGLVFSLITAPWMYRYWTRTPPHLLPLQTLTLPNTVIHCRNREGKKA